MEPEVKLEQPESLDDVPLIIGMAKQMKLDELIEQYFPTHGSQNGLGNGKLALGWLAFILSQSNHCKNAVREWANNISSVLGALLQSQIREVEFSDDRLANLLDKLSDDIAWNAFEEGFSKSIIEIYDLPIETVRVDGSAACGYHEVTENGIMQFGHTKDYRPDLPQLKMMLATLDPGLPLAIDVVSGEQNDDILYTPLIRRVRPMINKTGVLFVGDCKMSSLAIRGGIEEKKDYYLSPLALGTEKIRLYFQKLVDAIVDGTQEAVLIYKKIDINTPIKNKKTDAVTVEDNKMHYKLIGAGYEVEREQECGEEEKIKWNERIFVYRSIKFAESEIAQLERTLKKAEAELLKLTPNPGKNSRQYYEEAKLNESINKILKKYEMSDLFKVTYHTEAYKKLQRYVIKVERNEDEVNQKKNKCGWRPMVTNTSKEKLSFQAAIETYRAEWTLERCFRISKKSHLGISPLYLRKDKRLKGITRLLSIGVRIITLLEYHICKNLKETEETILGLDVAHPNKAIKTPTAQSIFKKFCREKIMLSRVIVNGKIYWGITQMSETVRKVLIHLKIPLEVYEVAFYQNWSSL